MRGSWAVAHDLWLGVARPDPPGPPLAGSRYARDREASALAERAAVACSGRHLDELTVSRAHTCGIGAAVVSPAKLRVGVDLVLADRVTERHLAGILTPAESAALARFGSTRPPLAWGLKEAAAKASGEAGRWFPHGLLIEDGAAGLLVRTFNGSSTCFGAGWVVLGGFLCVWVREVGGGAGLPMTSPPNSGAGENWRKQ